jgi:proteic killer suppression protein
MIRSFAEPRVEKFFRHGICPARWRAFEDVAKRKLDMLDAATKLSDVRMAALRGDRHELHHAQFRVRFRWTEQGPVEIEIADR